MVKNIFCLKINNNNFCAVLVKLIFLILGILLIASCASMRKLKKISDYDFSSKREVGVFVKSSRDPDKTETLASTTMLYFFSKGYSVKNINHLLNQNSNKTPEGSISQLINSLNSKPYLSNIDIYSIVEFDYDSVFIPTEIREEDSRKYWGYNVARISIYMEIVDADSKEGIYSFSTEDTTKIYRFVAYKDRLFYEYDWLVFARQLQNNLKDFPDSKNSFDSQNHTNINIDFWVDKSYREAFSKDWNDKINKMVSNANHILRSEFNLNIISYNVYEWNQKFRKSLLNSFEMIYNKKFTGTNSFVVGLTFDNSLISGSIDRTFLGFAETLGKFVIMTAKPSFPGLIDWKSAEDATTLVHEIAHLFGAIHVPDKYSILFSRMSSLYFRVDEINKTIVNKMKNNFWELDKNERFAKYFNTLIELNEGNFKNKIPVLSLIYSKLIGANYGSEALDYISEDFLAKVNDITRDSVYLLALQGVCFFKLKKLDLSIHLLKQAVSLKPDFAEAHWYLSKAYYENKNQTDYFIHKNLVGDYEDYWLVESKPIKSK